MNYRNGALTMGSILGTVRRGLLACGVLALLFIVEVPTAWAAPDDDYQVAVELYKKERWDDAARSFQQFLRDNPQHAEAESALLYAGFALVNAGDYAAAQGAFEQFGRQFPNSERRADALYRLGETSYSLGDYDRSEKELGAFLTAYPEHSLREWALPYLGDTELRLNKYGAAVTTFRKAIAEFPEGPLTSESEFGLARALEFDGKKDEALATFEAIVEKKGPRAPASQMRVATIYYDTQKFDDAAREFNQLVAEYPQSNFAATAQLNAGFSAYRARKYDEAVTALEKAAPLGENAASANYWIGMARKGAGDQAAAVTAFRKVVDEHGESPFAEEAAFQMADSALRGGDARTALEHFERIAEQEPASKHAAAALYFAGEAALMVGDARQAEHFIRELDDRFANSAYAAHAGMLSGRILEARAAEAGLSAEGRSELQEEALGKYEQVLTESQTPATAAKARYQIARLREARGEHKESLAVLEPLVEEVREQGESSPHLEALLLQARAELALGQLDQAASSASEFLRLAPTSSLASSALTTRGLAHIALKKEVEATADWNRLEALAKNQPALLPPVARQFAERAYASEQWPLAAHYFQKLGELAGDGAEGAIGLSGLGWSMHQQGEFEQAATAFGELLKQFPTAERLAPEAAYMQGKSLQDAGKLPEAAAAYTTAFETFAPKEPAPAGAEVSGTGRHAYLSGLQLARVLRLQGDVAKSDAAYAAVVKAFPKPANLDHLLEEWALLHYEAEDFEKSDALYQRLLDEVPNSPRAANARLILAESAMMNGDLTGATEAVSRIAEDGAAPPETRQRAESLRISLAREQRNWDEAARLADAFLTKHANSRERPLVSYIQGEALLQTDRGEEAKGVLSLLEQLPAEAPARKEAWFPRVKLLLAEIGFQQKDYKSALERLDEFEKIEPAPAYHYASGELRGRIFKQQAKFDEARAAFEKVLATKESERTETAARAQYGIAETYFLQERWEEARAAAFRVYSLYSFPQWQAPALLMVGLSDEMMKQPAKAIDAFRDVVAEFPQSAEATKAREKLRTLGASSG